RRASRYLAKPRPPRRPTMTIHETAQPSAHPYRGAIEPFTLDCDELRVPYSGQTRMRLTLSSGLAHGRIVIDPAAQDLIAIHCGDGPVPHLRIAAGEIALSWRVSFGDWLRTALRPCNRDVAIVLHPPSSGRSRSAAAWRTSSSTCPRARSRASTSTAAAATCGSSSRCPGP